MRSRCCRPLTPFHTTYRDYSSVCYQCKRFPGLRPELIEKNRVVEATTDEGEQNYV